MNRFAVVAKENGKFVVASVHESFDEMDSRDAAETACAQLNYEPGRNACDVFLQGRWTQKQTKEVA